MICRQHLDSMYDAIKDRGLDKFCVTGEAAQQEVIDSWELNGVNAKNFEPLLLAIKFILQSEHEVLGHHKGCAVCHMILHMPNWHTSMFIDHTADKIVHCAASFNLIAQA